MKPKPKRKSVYRSQNATLRALFERAGEPSKVLCVPLDYACLLYTSPSPRDS